MSLFKKLGTEYPTFSKLPQGFSKNVDALYFRRGDLIVRMFRDDHEFDYSVMTSTPLNNNVPLDISREEFIRLYTLRNTKLGELL